MFVAVLLQGDLLVRPGIRHSEIYHLEFRKYENLHARRLILARRRGDRREIELLQGLLHAAQQSTAKVTRISPRMETETTLGNEEGRISSNRQEAERRAAPRAQSRPLIPMKTYR